MNTMVRRLSTGCAALALLGSSVVMAAHHEEKADIVDTAVAAGSFTTLVTAVQAADLVDTLKGEGPFTVFAPTDEAFAKLPAGTVEDLLKPENKEQLVSILTYHVVPGSIMAADAMNATSATTVQGGDLAISTSGDQVMINDATVVQADVKASNGVIHAIDTVLMP
ncbi:fasciclin domain-containing protein [Oceanimonas sp. GK1]|uniref:fasciclin domain-containing protein n=1 Tax=Oceanimonas sp. (strain GK1 / IBRC-M 10197) TaxID=511062 RepID=UPI00192B913D|nr:fasciclin domain-containing protein [Oceanimonas sp. GK1]